VLALQPHCDADQNALILQIAHSIFTGRLCDMHECCGDGAKTSEAQSALVQARFSRVVFAAKNGNYSHLDEFIAAPEEQGGAFTSACWRHHPSAGARPQRAVSAHQRRPGFSRDDIMPECDNITPSLLPVSAFALQPSIKFLDDVNFLKSTLFAPAMFLHGLISDLFGRASSQNEADARLPDFATTMCDTTADVNSSLYVSTKQTKSCLPSLCPAPILSVPRPLHSHSELQESALPNSQYVVSVGEPAHLLALWARCKSA